MAYSRTTWVESETAVSPSNMNNIEDGIEEALAKVQGNQEMWEYIRNLVYPVGSIYMSVSNRNPGELFGGTWVAWGSGRVPVGVNTAETDFNSAEKSGGTKTVTLTEAQIPSHNHSYNTPTANTGATELTVEQMPKHSHVAGITPGVGLGLAMTGQYRAAPLWVYNSSYPQSTSPFPTGTTGGGKAHTHPIGTASANTGNKGGGGAHNNLQPYITCYMWKRTA